MHLPMLAGAWNPFSFCFDNSVIVWILIGSRPETAFGAVETIGLLSEGSGEMHTITLSFEVYLCHNYIRELS